ncbi:acetate--CoA ligase family protein [Microvirga antarctica]|uniref:acetate--CoA ligase family protein n=1 Tax=Microvirga antarctica TaxID=2819233 RepID=UPI001B306805|nr:acetate--CoA ligase family protein [Microvirga antarctica]
MQQASIAKVPSVTVGRILDEAITRRHSALDEHSAKAILSEIGIDVPKRVRIAPGQAVASALSGLRPPFVLKGLASQAIHKSDIGAVVLGLSDAAAVESCCAEIHRKMVHAGYELTGYLIEEMASPGIEIVIGGVTDPQLGPMLMVGAGGVYAEILKDVSFRLCPIDARDAHEMVSELKIAPILNGARGRSAVDIKRIHAALLALGGESGFFTTYAAQVTEFDLNPLIASPDGLIAVDSRMVLAGGER